jgi:hypothetical protein
MRRAALGAAALLLLAAGCHAPAPPVQSPPAPTRLSIEKNADFHGWPAIVIRGGTVEAVVVPAIGRVMQFRLRDSAGEGPFWQHPRLARGMPADENGWTNYGGDKAWPAPQTDWPKVAGRGWPPPATFDARPFTATVNGNEVRLTSEVDPAYGVRVERTIRLDPEQPVMAIDTRYRKVAGGPVRLAAWTITQLVSPKSVVASLPERSVFPSGYKLEMPVTPRDLQLSGTRLSLARDPVNKTMIGTDADALEWIGEHDALLLTASPQSAPPPGAAWADGVHAQIYTSSDDALPYVELELLGPVRELRAGDSAEIVVRYELSRL